MAWKSTLNFEKQLKSVLHLESLSNIDQWNYVEDRDVSTHTVNTSFLIKKLEILTGKNTEYSKIGGVCM